MPAGESDYSNDGQIEVLAEKIGSMSEAGAIPWHLDLSGFNGISIFAATMITAVVLNRRLLGQPTEVILPTHPEAVEFCKTSGLTHYLTGSPYPDPNDPENLTAPIQRLTQSSFADPNAIVSLLRRHFNLEAEAEDLLRICVNELIQNVQDHASSPIGAVIGARFLAGSPNTFCIATVDCGIGIATSLKKRHPDVSDATYALERVIKGGYSAKSRPNNMGVGISNVAAIVGTQLGGVLHIISEDGWARGSPLGLHQSRTLRSRFPGTGVFMAFLLPQSNKPKSI
jgi:hypothetical protein